VETIDLERQVLLIRMDLTSLSIVIESKHFSQLFAGLHTHKVISIYIKACIILAGTRDGKQRKILQKCIAAGANVLEAFSNSPPEW